MTRLDPVCARDSFGASPCALFRERAGILRGSPCCLPRAIFTCIHICISHMYVYMYTHMYITHVYLHTYKYVYHTCIFTYINICISHIKPLFRSPALSSAYNVHTQPPLKAPETRRLYDTDTHRNTSIGSRSLARVYVYSTQQHTGSSQQHTGSSQQHTACRQTAHSSLQ